MSAFVSLRATAVAVVLLATAGVVALATPASAAPPVARDEHKWIYPGQYREIDVLANDSDPDGDDLAICRVDEGEHENYYVDVHDDKLLVAVGDDRGADITIDYYVCDYETLVPATLTISFRELYPMKVVKLDRPGRLRVTNDNNRAVKFLYGDFRKPRPDGRVRVDPHDSVVLRVHRQRIDWIALLTRSTVVVGIGHVRGIDLPAGERTARAQPTFTRAEDRLWTAQR